MEGIKSKGALRIFLKKRKLGTKLFNVGKILRKFSLKVSKKKIEELY